MLVSGSGVIRECRDVCLGKLLWVCDAIIICVVDGHGRVRVACLTGAYKFVSLATIVEICRDAQLEILSVVEFYTDSVI
jgi:hypothetical protein